MGRNKELIDFYSIHHNRSIKHNRPSLGLKRKNSEEIGDILFESFLFKYKPSFTEQYLERWCQATSSCFYYYPNKEGPKEWLYHPMIKVQINTIDTIQRVCVDLVPNQGEEKFLN